MESSSIREKLTLNLSAVENATYLSVASAGWTVAFNTMPFSWPTAFSTCWPLKSAAGSELKSTDLDVLEKPIRIIAQMIVITLGTIDSTPF